jgi:hypothetical protein
MSQIELPIREIQLIIVILECKSLYHQFFDFDLNSKTMFTVVCINVLCLTESDKFF